MESTFMHSRLIDKSRKLFSNCKENINKRKSNLKVILKKTADKIELVEQRRLREQINEVLAASNCLNWMKGSETVRIRCYNLVILKILIRQKEKFELTCKS